MVVAAHRTCIWSGTAPESVDMHTPGVHSERDRAAARLASGRLAHWAGIGAGARQRIVAGLSERGATCPFALEGLGAPQGFGRAGYG